MLLRSSNSQQLRTSGKFVLGSCVIVIVIAVIAIAAYRVSNRDAVETNTYVNYQTLSIVSLVSALSSSLPVTYHFLHHAAATSSISVGYQVPGYSFRVALPTMSPNATFTDVSTMDEQVTYDDLSKAANYTNNYLYRQGFVAVPSQNQTSGFLSAIYFYKRSSAVCRVTVYTTLSIACALSQDLQTIATETQPLIDIYEKVMSGNGTVTIATPNIRASETPGYTIATLPVYSTQGQTNVNFYRQANGDWQMINLNWYNDPNENGNILPNCADFESSTSISQAFTGQTCYDSTTRMTRTIRG